MATDTSLRPMPRISWSSLFAGTFVFLAIEATFGVLGAAIFANATNPAARNPVGTGISVGFGIWMVILSIISLYYAGRVAGRMSGAESRNQAMWHGLICYGMCLFTAALLTSLSVFSVASNTANTVNPSEGTVVHAITVGGYWLFAALVLSMIAAAVGGASGAGYVQRMGRASVTRMREAA